MMRASVVSSAAVVLSISSAPSPLMVPAKTSASDSFAAGMLSPGIGDWLTLLAPATTRPARGLGSPGLAMEGVRTAHAAAGRDREGVDEGRVGSVCVA